MHKTLIMAGMLATTLALIACSANQAPADSAAAPATSAPATLIGGAVDRALERASEELRTRNITISDHNGTKVSPKAQITPQGDLLIGDKTVPVTAAQRAMLLDYRARIEDIATQGMAIGKQGAALGMNAAADALAGAFSGQSEEQIRQRVEAQASGIKQSAAALCERMPGLLTAQQKLAAALPEFKPYATMTPRDITECKTDADK